MKGDEVIVNLWGKSVLICLFDVEVSSKAVYVQYFYCSWYDKRLSRDKFELIMKKCLYA